MLIRQRTFSINELSISALSAACFTDVVLPNLHICAKTSASRSGRSLLDTDTPRMAQMVRLNRFFVYSMSMCDAKKLLDSFSSVQPAATIIWYT